ncbi:Putative uncharacterized protein [Moritella viscosa]|uniref:DUF3696 domain-containing protein n=1 Tax=Moritella viscosa TaxID=80854 RepID=UPI0009224A0F|nr:DUF3696 domain-containing protein [Moritella viscosa]SGY86586.1 Putative uncharacterized protein [Moritella viscosa]
MLNKIKLSNFKCYQSQKFDFSNLTVFCGNNSVGKSTAIQALLFAFQSNFSSKLELSGDFIDLGSYQDIHNRDAEFDSLSIEVINDDGSLKWGYLEEEFEPAKAKLVEESPLPLIEDDSSRQMISSLREKYSDSFTFLSAERLGPRNNYPYSIKRRSPFWLGIHGQFTSQVLDNLKTKNVIFHEGDERRHAKAHSRELADNLYAWMSEISPGVFIKSDSIKSANVSTNQFKFGEHFYRAVNVGFGLSYVLPVVLSLLMTKSGGLIIIENPEAHLHPRGQSYLGRLIALAAQAGVQVIIETHSDHIINGMRIMPRLGLVDCKNITIYQVFSGEEYSEVEKITVDAQGQLSEWPTNFFDQQLIDMDILMSGKDI